MELFTFKAFAFGGELDLNRLAVKLGITRKYRWEEPMKLNPLTFALATATILNVFICITLAEWSFSTAPVILLHVSWTVFLNMPSL